MLFRVGKQLFELNAGSSLVDAYEDGIPVLVTDCELLANKAAELLREEFSWPSRLATRKGDDLRNVVILLRPSSNCAAAKFADRAAVARRFCRAVVHGISLHTDIAAANLRRVR